MTPVRTALVGIGGIGAYHRSVIHQLPQYELVAVAERYQDRQVEHVEAVKSWGVPVYDDIWAMLDDVEVEAITIAVPHHFHAEYTLGSLERGLHVLCEKPVTVLGKDALAELQIAEDKGLWVGVDFQYTSYPHSLKLKQLIVDGGLGELREVVAVVSWKRLDVYYSRADWVGKRFVEGRACFDGVLMNQAVHLLNTSLQMGTREPGHATPLQVQAETYTVHANIETEDLACLRADLGEATLYFYPTTCNMNRRERTTLDIIGTKGRAIWSDAHATAILQEGTEMPFDAPADRDAIHKNFCQCIRGEADELYAALREALKATWTINGAYCSAGQIKRIGWDAVADIHALIEQAAQERKLFSEMGVDWAFQGAKVGPAEWSKFNGEMA